jgi:hypothetical protein
VGQWVVIHGTGKVTVSAGGTWAWLLVGSVEGGIYPYVTKYMHGGIVAGGTQINAEVSNVYMGVLCWRIA